MVPPAKWDESFVTNQYNGKPMFFQYSSTRQKPGPLVFAPWACYNDSMFFRCLYNEVTHMISFQEQEKIFHLQGNTYSYILCVKDGMLMHMYWGKKLPSADIGCLFALHGEGASFDSAFSRAPMEVFTQERRAITVSGPSTWSIPRGTTCSPCATRATGSLPARRPSPACPLPTSRTKPKPKPWKLTSGTISPAWWSL